MSWTQKGENTSRQTIWIQLKKNAPLVPTTNITRIFYGEIIIMADIQYDMIRYKKALITIGQRDKAEEMITKVFGTKSPEEAEEIMKSYFTFKKGEEFIDKIDTFNQTYYSGDSTKSTQEEQYCKDEDCGMDEVFKDGLCKDCWKIKNKIYVCELCSDDTNDDLSRLCDSCYKKEYGN